MVRVLPLGQEGPTTFVRRLKAAGMLVVDKGPTTNRNAAMGGGEPG